MTTDPAPRLRVDKWLWQARFFKTRGRAGEVAVSGRLRINGTRCEKAAQAVRPGDVLTFPQECSVRVVRVEGLGTRRGPAPEAATLYTDLEPVERPDAGSAGPRPTGRDRRKIDALHRNDT